MADGRVHASIRIAAPPERVFDHFTDPRLLVRWLGDAARLTPRPGGEFAVDVRDSAIRGRFVEVVRPRRVVFTWGRAGSAELPAGSTTVEVTLTPVDGGTEVVLVHRDLPQEEAGRHSAGWQHFLGRLPEAVAG